MILLDSDVLSSLLRATPDATVKAWADRQPRALLHTTSVTIYEIRKGIERLPEGNRRRHLAVTLEHFLATLFFEKVLPFDAEAAEHAARLSADRERRGLNIALGDTMIAGIVLLYGAAISTGNVKDFRDLGTRVINPWDASSG